VTSSSSYTRCPLLERGGVSTAGESLPSATPQSVLVVAYPDSLQVTLARGNKQRIIEVAP
jgi:hypothetical protein